jgi:hypothetical protein
MNKDFSSYLEDIAFDRILDLEKKEYKNDAPFEEYAKQGKIEYHNYVQQYSKKVEEGYNIIIKRIEAKLNAQK